MCYVSMNRITTIKQMSSLMNTHPFDNVTKMCVHLQLLYQEKNEGVAYEYSVPKGVTQAEAETYDWIFGTFGECSEECGGGELLILLLIDCENAVRICLFLFRSA